MTFICNLRTLWKEISWWIWNQSRLKYSCLSWQQHINYPNPPTKTGQPNALHLVLHNKLYWQPFCLGPYQATRRKAGRADFLMQFGERNMGINLSIWLGCVKNVRAGAWTNKKKWNEQGEMDFLPFVIYDQSPVYLQIRC